MKIYIGLACLILTTTRKFLSVQYIFKNFKTSAQPGETWNFVSAADVCRHLIDLLLTQVLTFRFVTIIIL
jgi:hypothetical protein